MAAYKEVALGKGSKSDVSVRLYLLTTILLYVTRKTKRKVYVNYM